MGLNDFRDAEGHRLHSRPRGLPVLIPVRNQLEGGLNQIGRIVWQGISSVSRGKTIAERVIEIGFCGGDFLAEKKIINFAHIIAEIELILGLLMANDGHLNNPLYETRGRLQFCLQTDDVVGLVKDLSQLHHHCTPLADAPAVREQKAEAHGPCKREGSPKRLLARVREDVCHDECHGGAAKSIFQINEIILVEVADFTHIPFTPKPTNGCEGNKKVLGGIEASEALHLLWNPTNERLVYEWLKFAGKYDPKTTSAHLADIRRFEAFIGLKDLTETTADDASAYRNRLVRGTRGAHAGEKPLSTSTVRHAASYLKQFFEWLSKYAALPRLNTVPDYFDLAQGASPVGRIGG